MHKIKIFLASSEELKTERLELADLVCHMNLALENDDAKIYLVKWEYLDASMSEIHKQEEYNRTLEKCSLCCVLFATRFGKYTESELKTAYDKFCSGSDSKDKLTVFFKEAAAETDELREFKSSFHELYPGIPEASFDSVPSLKKAFLNVWNKYQKDHLENMYPVLFTENHAILKEEKLLDF